MVIFNNIFGKFKRPNKNIKVVLIVSFLQFLLYSTVSPINIIEANSNIIKPEENKMFFDIYHNFRINFHVITYLKILILCFHI